MYTLTLADIERARRMDIADAQSRIVHFTNWRISLGSWHGWNAQRKYCNAEIDRAHADIAEARRDIVALRAARHA